MNDDRDDNSHDTDDDDDVDDYEENSDDYYDADSSDNNVELNLSISQRQSRGVDYYIITPVYIYTFLTIRS